MLPLSSCNMQYRVISDRYVESEIRWHKRTLKGPYLNILSRHSISTLSIDLLFSSTGHSLWLSGLFHTMLIVVPILWLERNWPSYVFEFEKSIELTSTHWAFPLQLRAQYPELQLSLCDNTTSLRWRHNGRDCVSNHQPYNCLLNRLFGCRSK